MAALGKMLVVVLCAVEMLHQKGSCQELRANTYVATTNAALRGHAYRVHPGKSRLRCARLCDSSDRCRSFNHDRDAGTCQLNAGRQVDFPAEFGPDQQGFDYFEVYVKPDPCAQRRASGDNLSQANFSWPLGTYGLPLPKSGCPDNVGFNWTTGFRMHDTEDNYHSNEWSATLHLKGSFQTYDMKQKFCMKTVGRVGACDFAWPQGEYCVFKFGDRCPTDMSPGSIFWDDEDNYNINRVKGILPSGQYGNNTRIDYCCMVGGSASQPIVLPTRSPFYLFPYTEQCQEVTGMTVSQEWFKWDCENDNPRTDPVGTHPYYEPIGLTDLKIFYCYYKAM